MASKQELIQAHRFSRRRLLTAFTSGAPGGRELAPAKPLRGVVVGLALAVLTAVGTLVVGSFTGTLPDGWKDASVVVVKGEGTRYVAINGTLYPFLNLASARLATGSSDILEVTADQLAGMPRESAPIGIADAPDALPEAARLIDAAWTSCVSDEIGRAIAGETVYGEDGNPIEAAPSTRIATAGVPGTAPVADIVLDPAGTAYYVTGSMRYEIPAQVEAMSLALQVTHQPRTVNANWLNLLDQGTPLRALSFDRLGQPAEDTDLRVGQMVQTQDAEGAVTGDYIVTDNSRLVRLNAFARELAAMSVSEDPTLQEPVTMSVTEAGPLISEESAIPEDWPTYLAAPAEGATCVRMEPSEFPATDGAEVLRPTVTVSAAPADLTPGPVVEPGGGALVDAVSAGGGDAFGYISENGVYFPIATFADVERLGYARDDIVIVPAGWARLFPIGPELSQDATGVVASEGS
ncbi:type VII secretion protein EccB [Microbacterium petrolearium]